MATLPAVDLFSVSALILPFSTFIPSFSCFLTLRSFLRHSLWLQAEFRFHFSRYSPLIFCLLLNVQLFTRPSLNTHLSSLSIPHYLSFLILSLVPFLTTSLYALYSWLTLFLFLFFSSSLSQYFFDSVALFFPSINIRLADSITSGQSRFIAAYIWC